MTWKQYIVNLVNAGVSGATVVVVGGMAGLTLKQIAITAGGAFLVSSLKWYLQHKPPGVIEE